MEDRLLVFEPSQAVVDEFREALVSQDGVDEVTRESVAMPNGRALVVQKASRTPVGVIDRAYTGINPFESFPLREVPLR